MRARVTSAWRFGLAVGVAFALSAALALNSCARGGGAPVADPSVADACGDGLDGDSDGRVDEGCTCEIGAAQGCYPASDESLDHNPCRRGVQQCVIDGATAEWAPCSGAVVPGAEKCDGIDNDCNGAVDDVRDCTCDPNKPARPCYTGPAGTENKGACAAGSQRCRTDGSGWGECEGETRPSAEVCGNDVDEDCDGVLNNSPDVDGDGVHVCDGDCDDQDPERKPGLSDGCDGKDNDCDSNIDEEATPQSATCGVGVCANTGLRTCQGGTWQTQCVPKAATGPDNDCDALDDDCDGSADDEYPVTACDHAGDADLCNDDQRRCVMGVPTCVEVGGSIAEVCNGADDNCNGQFDEAGCPAGCTVKSYNNHRYLYCGFVKNWLEARTVCTTYGYDLVKIESAAENTTVFTELTAINNQDKWWLGLNDRTPEAGSNPLGFRWTDGTAPTGYSTWYAGEPNNFGNGTEGEDCVLINYMGSAGWNDAICSEPHRFVCEHN